MHWFFSTSGSQEQCFKSNPIWPSYQLLIDIKAIGLPRGLDTKNVKKRKGILLDRVIQFSDNHETYPVSGGRLAVLVYSVSAPLNLPFRGKKANVCLFSFLDKLVLILAILAGVFGALAVILLVVLIVTCCKRKGKDFEQPLIKTYSSWFQTFLIIIIIIWKIIIKIIKK